MTPRTMILIAAGGSLALLLGAWTFQALGYAPCKMCYWQRWPHMAAVVIGAAALLLPVAMRPLALLGAVAAATTGVIGVYHTGVERGWWPGPTSCSGGADLGGISGSDLLSVDTVDKVIMCDEVSWSLFGLSMASWNAVASFALALIWLRAWRLAAIR
ncbi:disulfide bond formation protein B [Palleronia caenipelagi]|uniref:Disulfide bond formation protein B n=1 Tax=Palleronia caenipelagi TaxID=2489174 RepID=A0A547PQJ3_9RHOB|nr:disulfide bond formation protein B [Palleronia caenipelagi]TRD16412.1 disulfide bond formation protein B [Palleronia caenipelagi]